MSGLMLWALFFFMGQSCNLLHWEEIPVLSLKWVASSIVGWTSESGMLRFSISRPASKNKKKWRWEFVAYCSKHVCWFWVVMSLTYWRNRTFGIDLRNLLHVFINTSITDFFVQKFTGSFITKQNKLWWELVSDCTEHCIIYGGLGTYIQKQYQKSWAAHSVFRTHPL